MKKAPTFVDAFQYIVKTNYCITNFLVAVLPSSVTFTM